MVHCSRVVAFGVCSLQTPEVVIISLIFELTTTSLIGGWVPETSRSFHYWQPAHRWRFLPRLANPGNPVMSPLIGKGNRHPSHWIDSRKREGISGEKLPGWRATTPCNATSTCSKYTQECLQCRAHGNSHTCAYAKTADYQKTQMLFVVNPVNLHLAVTAFMTANLIYSC